MYKNKKILALIPARGGSKGLPGKNIRQMSGKPLIAWTIRAAKKSRYIDRVIVSTDDDKIADISAQYGAEVPFMRPKALARDNSMGIDVALHAIKYMEENGDPCDLIVYLQPTSPLRLPGDIDHAIELLFSKKARAIVSVCEAEHHPYLANTLPRDKCMKNFLRKGAVNKNRQKLALFYRLNGAVYLSDWGYIKSQKSFFGSGTYAYVMPARRSIDIDSEVDLRYAECLLSYKPAGTKE